jgi:hypothetical protein
LTTVSELELELRDGTLAPDANGIGDGVGCRITNIPGIYLTNRIAGGYALAWSSGTFAALAGRHRRNCVAARCF